jgi:hypothetical protein
MNKGVASLNYLSLGVGFIIGLQFCGRLIDIVSLLLIFSSPCHVQ